MAYVNITCSDDLYNFLRAMQKNELSYSLTDEMGEYILDLILENKMEEVLDQTTFQFINDLYEENSEEQLGPELEALISIGEDKGLFLEEAEISPPHSPLLPLDLVHNKSDHSS